MFSRRKKTSLLVKLVIRKVASFALFCAFFLISIFVRVEIVRLYSSRIGHLTYDFDNYHHVWRLKPDQSQTLVVFVLDSEVANEDIFRSLRTLIPGVYLRGWPAMIVRPLINSEAMARFVVPFSMLQPKIPQVGNSPKLLDVSRHEIQQIASVTGLDVGSYVVFHNRDSKYLEITGNDGNWHDLRDFDFESFQESIELLAKRQVASVRMGVHTLRPVAQSNVVDVSGGSHNPSWDLPLVEGGKFFVTGNTGVSYLSRIQRKPHLYVNYIPLRLDHMASFPKKSIILPKRLRNCVTEEYVSLRETVGFFLGWSIHRGSDFFEESRFEWVDNSPAEIAGAVGEMLLRIENRWVDPPLLHDLHVKAREAFQGEDLKTLVFDELGIRFAASFLSQFPELQD